MPQRVIDSHIHLFAEPHLDNLRWMTPDGSLHANHRLDEYQLTCSSPDFEVVGVIFIETDVKSSLNEQDWERPIDEYLFVERTINHCQLNEEGNAFGGGFIKGIVPWAPVPLGAEGLGKFVTRMKKETSVKGNWSLVKGFRYLLQDKPDGTMVQSTFVDGLNWLSKNSYVFDLGIDINSHGINQLREWDEVDSQVKGLTIIVNHLCKPNFSYTESKLAHFKQLWKEISARDNNQYFIKLSGGFSELTRAKAHSDIEEIANEIIPWVRVFVEVFGKDKLIWGSDWPVSTIKFKTDAGVEETNALRKWALVVRRICEKLDLNEEKTFYTNSLIAYNIESI